MGELTFISAKRLTPKTAYMYMKSTNNKPILHRAGIHILNVYTIFCKVCTFLKSLMALVKRKQRRTCIEALPLNDSRAFRMKTTTLSATRIKSNLFHVSSK